MARHFSVPAVKNVLHAWGASAPRSLWRGTRRPCSWRRHPTTTSSPLSRVLGCSRRWPDLAVRPRRRSSRRESDSTRTPCGRTCSASPARGWLSVAWRDSRRGRPRHKWAIRPEARPGDAPPEAYGQLGRWLARAADDRGHGRDRGDRARDRARAGSAAGPPPCRRNRAQRPDRARLRAAHRTSATPERALPAPQLPVSGRGAREQPAICTLHRGITRGLLDVADPRVELTAFVPKDPYPAGCLIELSLAPGPIGGIVDGSEAAPAVGQISRESARSTAARSVARRDCRVLRTRGPRGLADHRSRQIPRSSTSSRAGSVRLGTRASGPPQTHRLLAFGQIKRLQAERQMPAQDAS